MNSKSIWLESQKELKRLLEGDDARRRTAKDYHVTQLSHKIHSPKDKPVKGVFKNDYKEYFEIKLTHKITREEIFFRAGSHVSKRLLAFAGQAPLPVFSLEREFNRVGGGGGGKGGSLTYTPLNHEIYFIVQLYAQSYGMNPPKFYAEKILQHVALKPLEDVPHELILKFNDSIEKETWKNKRRTLSQICNEVAQRGENFRKFEFKLVPAIVGPGKYLSM